MQIQTCGKLNAASLPRISFPLNLPIGVWLLNALWPPLAVVLCRYSAQNTIVVSRTFFTQEVNEAFEELEEGNEVSSRPGLRPGPCKKS